MKNLFKNRYAFVIVGEHDTGKSTMVNQLTGYAKIQYNSPIRLSLNHKTKEAEFSTDADWNTVVSAHSFYCENDEDTIKILEGCLQKPQAQFALVPEQESCLPCLVGTLSQNNYLTACYHIWLDTDDGFKRYININKANFELGAVGTAMYNANLQRIKQDMYRIIMPMS